MRNFFLIKPHSWGLAEVYQENPRQKHDLLDTRTIVQSLSNVQCGVFRLSCSVYNPKASDL